MFRKKVKKNFPPGTFIPTPARVMAILQLCIAFTLIAWICSKPFLGDLFALKSKMLLYQNVMGRAALIPGAKNEEAKEHQAKLMRNEERFMKLPDEERLKVEENYSILEEQLHQSFLGKLEKMVLLLFIETPPLEQGWIFFSVLIPILLLKRVEGAVPCVWLLPLIVLAYAIDNRLNGLLPEKSIDEQMFPTEEVIVKNYLEQPLSKSIFEQREQLKKGWDLYLIKEWGHQTPSENPKEFKKQAEDGEYAFNVARLDQQIDRDENVPDLPTPRRESLWTLGIYLFWNILFAVIISKTCRTNDSLA